MIESQTGAGGGSTEVTSVLRGTLWKKGRQAVASLVNSVQNRVQNWPADEMAGHIRGAGQAASRLAKRAQVRAILSHLSRWVQTGVREGAFVNRFALHLVVVFLAFGVLAVSRVNIPEIDFLLPLPTPAPELGDHSVSVAASPSNRGAGRFVNSNPILVAGPVAHTIIPERDRLEVITYTVQPSDNLFAIAQGFGLQAETILWANPEVEKAPDLLHVGQLLVVPPVDGIYYTVKAGDTVEKLAKDYSTTVEKIVGFKGNNLEEPYTLTAGQKLMLPDGRKKVVPWQNIYPMTWVGTPPKDAAKGSGRFAWPARGVLTQQFWAGHPAYDIANRTGTPIYAADAGYVRLAGQDTWGYGNQVVIDHGNGYVTRYAHLQKILVTAGQSVTKNQQIGTMGNTGRSTGPHLHFEIILNGVKRNPAGFLP